MDSFSKSFSHAVTSNLPIDAECGKYYFEVKIISTGVRYRREEIRIGISPEDVRKKEKSCYGNLMYSYDSIDGTAYVIRNKYHKPINCSKKRCGARNPCNNGGLCSGKRKKYGPKFSENDVIGCGIDFIKRTCFFTKNGKYLGVAFRNIDVTSKALWPTVHIPSYGKVKANFSPTIGCHFFRPDVGMIVD